MFDNKWQKKEMPLVSLIGMGGGIASPAFLASIVLNILKPTVFSPVDDTGVPDFDYTAESSAITNVGTVDALGGVGFSADIWTGDGNSNGQKIATGVDLLTDGGMVWIKARDRSSGDLYSRHFIWDTERGSTDTSYLSPDVEDAEGQQGSLGGKIDILSDGFTAGGPGANNNETYVGWSFRKAPGFFDIVTYDGDGGVQNVSHNLGQAPGIMIVKSTSHDGYGWYVYHHSVENAEGKYGNLHGPDQFNNNNMWNNTSPTDSVFTVTGNYTNGSGASFVAYLFADNPSQNIACGSYTESTTRQEVNIGFKPEFLLYKGESYGNWRLLDTTRGFSSDSPARTLEADNAEAEKNENAFFLRDNGFSAPSSWYGNGEKILYMAIGSPNFNVPATQLTLTDTTVSKVSDGSLVDGVSIDQALTVGESVKASGIESYWLTMISHSNNDTRVSPNGIAFDNAGGIYVAGQETSVDNAAYVAKFNDGGNISWQTSLNYEGANEVAFDVGVDSLNNVYSCGFSQKWDNQGAIIVKYNNSGTVQWQRLLSNTTGYGMRAEALTIDSSDNVIVVGYTPIQISGNQSHGVLIAKYNSSGVLQWARTLDQEGSGNRYEYGYGVAVDSSDNIYVCGEAGNSSYGSTDCLIAKYDSSGNIQWQKLLGDQYSTSEDRFRGITVDSSDNIYVVGHSQKHTSNDDTIVVKYDTSGNIVWQKYIQNGAKGRSIDTDSSGNVYVLSENLRDVGEGGSDAYIAKLDNSGNIQWQNALGGAYNEDSLCLRLDPSDNLYISGTTRSPSANADTTGLLFKIPTDGSLVGTYGGLTYQSVSLNIGTSSLQDRTSNFRDSAADSSGGGDNSQVNDSASTLPDEFDPGYTADITTISGVSGTVSASSGNTITLSNTTGTWSTGMKVQGTDSDAKDNPDPIKVEDVSLTSSAPTAERNVNTWGDAVWEIATDENFTQNVQTATTALSATGTQAGPSFTLEKETGYYTRTKYTALGQESEWSDVTYFVTKGLPVYADDVFSTYLYEGNGSSTSSTNTINNGIDLAGEGGLVWIKNRESTTFHQLFDTERGAGHYIKSNNSTQSQSGNHSLSSFNSNGFTLSWNPGVNGDGQNHVSWTFRKQPGFFDVVTYTGNSAAGHTISHNLGSTPGMIMIKNTSNDEQWQVWHRSVTGNLELDNEGAANTSSVRVDSVTNTSFNLTGAFNTSNANGQTYVAYIFAHDDQSFGTNSDEAIIKCGSYTGTGSSGNTVNLGFEPQFLLIKQTNTLRNWYLVDNMRGIATGQYTAYLQPNIDHAETDGAGNTIDLHATGFELKNHSALVNESSGSYVYMAIRRPHKPATVVSDVFAIDTKSAASGNTPQYTSNFPVDFAIRRNNINSQDSPEFVTRLTNALQYTNSTNAEVDGGATFSDYFAYNNGWANATNADSNDYLWMFKRSPGFMDVVTYTGTSGSRDLPHNLGVVPEMVIHKHRTGNLNWSVYHKDVDVPGDRDWWEYGGAFNSPSAFADQNYIPGTPTSTTYPLDNSWLNAGGFNNVLYLFASQPGISKVGSYTGNGPNGAQQVDCGFTNGAAFILVKNASSSGDWYLLDSERGINAYNETEPYITLNTNNSEQTANILGYHNVGFMISGQYGSASLNNANEKYIFFAVANP